jgi:hypothetical protein
MRRKHLLIKETGSTACGVKDLTVQEIYHMSKPHWNRHVNCVKCMKVLRDND